MRSLMVEIHRFEGFGRTTPELFFDGVRVGFLTVYWSRERVSRRLLMLRSTLLKLKERDHA